MMNLFSKKKTLADSYKDKSKESLKIKLNEMGVINGLTNVANRGEFNYTRSYNDKDLKYVLNAKYLGFNVEIGQKVNNQTIVTLGLDKQHNIPEVEKLNTILNKVDKLLDYKLNTNINDEESNISNAETDMIVYTEKNNTDLVDDSWVDNQ